jgi:DNA-binding transcriptional regulator/RsmH inhibitor MraZ
MSEDVFSGEYDRSVDNAGRIALPAILHELLGDRCYATKDPQGCIALRTPGRYADEANKVARREEKGKAPKGAARAFSTRTVILAVDKQGRLTLDDSSRKFAHVGAGTQATVVGNTNVIEIWNPQRWDVIKGEDAFGTPDRVWPADASEVDGHE